MAKRPKEQPEPGDRVKLKGRDARGWLRHTHLDVLWCLVNWDEDARGPKIVHLNELEKIEP